MDQQNTVSDQKGSARITIRNWTNKTLRFGRSGGPFNVPPLSSDYWHIRGSVWLDSPNGSSGFHAVNGDRYIVFEDVDGLCRFAYIGKDGYVAGVQKVGDDTPATKVGISDPLADE
jgi:hypothetical protein